MANFTKQRNTLLDFQLFLLATKIEARSFGRKFKIQIGRQLSNVRAGLGLSVGVRLGSVSTSRG